MFKKTAIALSLAMVAGTGLAAQNGLGVNADTNIGINAAGVKAGVNTGTSLKSTFKSLDTDGNGRLSRSEAGADAKVGAMFDSLDTNDSIEKGAKKSTDKGISYKQFKAGMNAKAHGGVVGSAVSKGKAHVVSEGESASTQAQGAVSGARDKAGRAASGARQKTRAAGNSMRGKAHSARDRVEGAGVKAETKAGAAADAAGDSASQRLNGAAGVGAGASLNGNAHADTGQDSMDAKDNQ